MNKTEFLAAPSRLRGVRDAVLAVQRDVAPEEWEVTLDYVGPLIELAVRDELPTAKASNEAGGFGAGDWMLLPIIFLVMGVLEERLEAGTVRDITEAEVRDFVRRSGSLPARKLVGELTRAVKKAFSRYLTAFLSPVPGKECHTDISCPRQVWKGSQRFSLVVRLTLDPAPLSAVDGTLAVKEGEPVLVTLQAPAFEVLTRSSQELLLPPNEDSAPVVFDLRPREAGPQHLFLDFLQDSHPLATLVVEVEVTEQPISESRAQAGSTTLRLEADVAPPDRVLRIFWDQDRSRLTMSLIQQGAAFVLDFPPVQMPVDPARMTADLFKDLNTLTDGYDPASKAVRGELRTLSSQEIDHELKVIGQNLWRLLPEEFMNLYSRERTEWSDRSLLIYSDEPHLPWELVWPHGEGWEDRGPWCLTMGLSRWLRRDEHGSGNVGAPGKIPMTALTCIATTDLPAAQREKAFLHDLLSQRGVKDLSPPNPTRETVVDLLGSGSCEWVHVAAHGNFQTDSPEGHSGIWLSDNAALTPKYFIGPAIEGSLRRARSAFILNACHSGRLGWSLTRIGGWAQRLLFCGAGMFLGPLWAVEDECAFRMAQSLYSCLLRGMTVAEAVRQARQACREAGNPTWLAYSLYAHPNAKIRLPEPETSLPDSGRLQNLPS